MGLFSSVLHVRNHPREKVLPALDGILRDCGFARTETVPITAAGPEALPKHNSAVSSGPYYLISPLNKRWLTMIEAHFAPRVRGMPQLSELSLRLSKALSCHTLALMVHDDDLFFYNLDRNGKCIDGYNSCPQYFEAKRLPDAKVEEQRHNPSAFRRLLPPGRTVGELRALLNRGWWDAYNTGALDEHGVVQELDDGFVFEGERMTAFGTLLQLHGKSGEYPYAAWADPAMDAWSGFIAVRYRKRR